MLFLDRWREIIETLSRNGVRTALTGLAVAWGVFMFILLVGAGQGLQNQVAENFRDDAINSIWIRPGKTSLPHEGLQPGRQLRFTNEDIEALRHLPGVEYLSGRFYMDGSYTVNYGAKNASFDVRSVHPDHQYLEKTIIVRGRYLNEIDIDEARKVAVIGVPVAEFFFGDQNPLGAFLTVRGIQYKIVGVFRDEGGEGELQKIYLPITTAQRAYNAHGRVDHLLFTVGNADLATSRHIEEKVRELLGERHHFDPEDRRALWLRNNVVEFHRIVQIFDLIRIFMWIVGLGTIIASVVGVGNIMLISVAERTVEIGVRKALGATPISIITMVVKESLLITGLAGYAGLCMGIGALELFSRFVPENDYIRNPEVDLSVAIASVALLVVAGALAGYVPASRAASINPVAALRDE